MPKTRTGSSMSSRQMARAAVGGRKVTFRFLAANKSVSGYLVGMDDYHWLIVTEEVYEPQITLVHKGSADLIIISREPVLASENDYVRDAVEEIGRGFFAFCDQTYFGKNRTPANAQP